MSAYQCGTCGRFVSRFDPLVVWAREPGEYGSTLHVWPARCGHCRRDERPAADRLSRGQTATCDPAFQPELVRVR